MLHGNSQAAVAELVAGAESGGTLGLLPDALARLPDVERGITRALHRTASPSEFVSVLQACRPASSPAPLASQPLICMPCCMRMPSWRTRGHRLHAWAGGCLGRKHSQVSCNITRALHRTMLPW